MWAALETQCAASCAACESRDVACRASPPGRRGAADGAVDGAADGVPPGLASGSLEAVEDRDELELRERRLKLNLLDRLEGLPPGELTSAGGLSGGLGGALSVGDGRLADDVKKLELERRRSMASCSSRNLASSMAPKLRPLPPPPSSAKPPLPPSASWLNPIRARLGVCFIACDLLTPALAGGPPLLAADESLTLARALLTSGSMPGGMPGGSSERDDERDGGWTLRLHTICWSSSLPRSALVRVAELF